MKNKTITEQLADEARERLKENQEDIERVREEINKTNETNKLDEILAEVQSKLAYDSKEILAKAKQQINKWALEKCLEEVREAFRKGYFASGVTPNEQNIDAFNIAYIHYFNQFTERARKEFRNE